MASASPASRRVRPTYCSRKAARKAPRGLMRIGRTHGWWPAHTSNPHQASSRLRLRRARPPERRPRDPRACSSRGPRA
jgi:hypothetical protein